MADTRKREKCSNCGLKGVTTTPPFYAYWKGHYERAVQRTKRCRYCGTITRHEATDLTEEERAEIIKGGKP